jgi:hypothetical protein
MPVPAENKLLEAIFGRGNAGREAEPEEESLKLHIKVRGGTPVDHHRSLCQTCSNSMVVKGAAVSERKILCSELMNGYGQAEVPYDVIVECSGYNDKTKLPLYEMKKIAFILKTDPRGKPIGFVPNREFRAEEKAAGEDSPDVVPGHYD